MITRPRDWFPVALAITDLEQKGNRSVPMEDAVLRSGLTPHRFRLIIDGHLDDFASGVSKETVLVAGRKTEVLQEFVWMHHDARTWLYGQSWPGLDLGIRTRPSPAADSALDIHVDRLTEHRCRTIEDPRAWVPIYDHPDEDCLAAAIDERLLRPADTDPDAVRLTPRGLTRLYLRNARPGRTQPDIAGDLARLIPVVTERIHADIVDLAERTGLTPIAVEALAHINSHQPGGPFHEVIAERLEGPEGVRGERVRAAQACGTATDLPGSIRPFLRKTITYQDRARTYVTVRENTVTAAA